MDEIYGKGGKMSDKRTECYVSSFKNLYKAIDK